MDKWPVNQPWNAPQAAHRGAKMTSGTWKSAKAALAASADYRESHEGEERQGFARGAHMVARPWEVGLQRKLPFAPSWTGGSQRRGGGDGLGDNQRPGRLAPRSFAVGGRFCRVPLLNHVRTSPALKK